MVISKQTKVMEQTATITEGWKAIKGFEGLYEVNPKGHVRSLPRTVLTSNDRLQTYKGRKLSPYKNSDGYLQFNLSKNGKRITKRAHRLKEEAFGL